MSSDKEKIKAVLEIINHGSIHRLGYFNVPESYTKELSEFFNNDYDTLINFIRTNKNIFSLYGIEVDDKYKTITYNGTSIRFDELSVFTQW